MTVGGASAGFEERTASHFARSSAHSRTERRGARYASIFGDDIVIRGKRKVMNVCWAGSGVDVQRS